jgi:hypothetical protein
MSLHSITILAGVLVVALRLPGVLRPAAYRDFCVKLPRNVMIGRILITLVALVVWWVMYHAATDEWKWAQPLVLVGVPVAYWLVIQFGTTYLAMRAIAALLLLGAKQILNAADASDSEYRLIMTVFAYLWVVGAIWMAAAPHHIRDVIGWSTATDQRCRQLCGIGVLTGVALIALGWLVY